MKGATVAKVLGGVALGYLLGRYLVPMVQGVDVTAKPDQAPSGDRPPIHRIAQDARHMCRELDPFFAQIERDAADGSLSSGDLINAYQQIRRISS